MGRIINTVFGAELCLLIGHDDEYEWVEWYAAGIGRAEVEMAECQRCGRKKRTGRDRPISE